MCIPILQPPGKCLLLSNQNLIVLSQNWTRCYCHSLPTFPRCRLRISGLISIQLAMSLNRVADAPALVGGSKHKWPKVVMTQTQIHL